MADVAAPIDPQQQLQHQQAQSGLAPQGDAFIQDADAGSGGDDDDDDEGGPKKNDKKAGRRKIKIEFIQDKSRRHITFSKRKAGIMKKAYELSTLTGTQVLLLVVSETGLVYTFTTAKLQPLVTQPEGKNLIQACLNAPHGQLPSSMPVGQPLGRAAPPVNVAAGGPAANNMPGGLSIPAGKDEEVEEEVEEGKGRKRQRRESGPRSATSPHTPANPQQPLNVPGAHSGQMTSPGVQHAVPPAGYNNGPGYHHAGPQGGSDPNMYGNHMMPPANYYSGPGSQPMGGMPQPGQQQHGHWTQPPNHQGNQYAGGRR